MTSQSWLEIAVKTLARTDVPLARLDALVLLEDATKKDRAWLLAHPEFELTQSQVSVLDRQVERRAKHEPLSYIRGKSEFYGREFIVNEHTLEPRPETEIMIGMLKHLVDSGQWTVGSSAAVVDVGTGSGCLAITTKLEFPDLQVYATDIDEKCIQTARSNAQKHNASIDFRQGNLLEPIHNHVARSDLAANRWVILANLPYVPESYEINTAATFEPKHAIFGGADGLDLYRELFGQIDTMSAKPTYILTESLPLQHNDLEQIARTTGYKKLHSDDFIQVFVQIPSSSA